MALVFSPVYHGLREEGDGEVNNQIDELMSNPYVEAFAFFSVAVLALTVFLTLWNMVTHYNDWVEIKKGNLAVALATGGKLFGICNIFRFSIANNDKLLDSVIWSAYGFVLLVVAYFIFSLLTPSFKISDELKQDNRAIGLISCMISIGLSYVIGASIK